MRFANETCKSHSGPDSALAEVWSWFLTRVPEAAMMVLSFRLLRIRFDSPWTPKRWLNGDVWIYLWTANCACFIFLCCLSKPVTLNKIAVICSMQYSKYIGAHYGYGLVDWFLEQHTGSGSPGRRRWEKIKLGCWGTLRKRDRWCVHVRSVDSGSVGTPMSVN